MSKTWDFSIFLDDGWRGVIGYTLSIRVTLSLGFLMGQGLQDLSCVGDFNGKLF